MERPTDHVEPGQALGQVGPWRLTGILGRGAAGVVFLAERAGRERPAALKLLAPGDTDRAALLRFRREGEILAQLDHPGIVQVLEAGSAPGQDPGAPGRPYLVTEVCPGESLRALLDRRGRLEPAEAARLCLVLAEALEHAHGHGVVHRDLKPANVIIDEGSGQPRLIDFGVARLLGSSEALTRTGTLLGTPLYMSPEQILGERALDARTDVWALGVILYECLAGQRPFQETDLVALARRIVAEPIPPLRAHDPGLPEALETVCRRALARDPSARYPGAGPMAADLRAFLASRGPAAAPPGGRWPRLPIGLAAAGLLALAAAWIAIPPADAPPTPPPAQSPPAAMSAPPPPPAPTPTPRPGPDTSRLSARELLREAVAQSRRGGPLEELLPLFDRAVARARPSEELLLAEAKLERADLLRRRGRHQQALALLEDLIASGAERIALEARLLRGILLIDNEKVADAFLELGDLHRRDPRGVVGLTASACLGAQERKRGVPSAEAALRLEPDYLPAKVARAAALLDQEQGEKSVMACEELASLAGDDPRVQLLVARLQLGLRDRVAARTALDRALALTEGHPYPLLLHTRIACLVALGDDDAVLPDCERTLQLLPEDGMALLYRGLIRHRRRDDVGAAEDWARAVQTLSGEALADRLRAFEPVAREAFQRATGQR